MGKSFFRNQNHVGKRSWGSSEFQDNGAHTLVLDFLKGGEPVRSYGLNQYLLLIHTTLAHRPVVE